MFIGTLIFETLRHIAIDFVYDTLWSKLNYNKMHHSVSIVNIFTAADTRNFLMLCRKVPRERCHKRQINYIKLVLFIVPQYIL